MDRECQGSPQVEINHSQNASGMNVEGDRERLKERWRERERKKREKERDVKIKEVNPEAGFYNPDAWARLVGKANTAPIYIDGKKCTALLDTGAQISFVSQQYCNQMGFEIHPIEKLIDFKGANGKDIDYLGYVEVNLQVPGKSFNQDVLLLVVPHISYHNYVPITLGTLTLETIDKSFVEQEEVESLEG